MQEIDIVKGVRGLSARLHVTPATIYRWLSIGVLDDSVFVKKGNGVNLFDFEAVRKCLMNHSGLTKYADK